MMATGPLDAVQRHLRRTVLAHDGESPSDGHLLRCFVARRDEAAFAELVRRHGRMVLSVCRRVVGHAEDAEDAFQATFLVLARKAASVVPPELVGNWLYGVAYRTALAARTRSVRRRAREKQVPDLPHPAVKAGDNLADLRRLLDDELSRLPEKYRVAVVLCELEERSRKDVARHLNLCEGTLSSRLATARKLLARRLSRRGVTFSAGALAAVLAQTAAPALAASAAAVARLAAGPAAGAVLVSAEVEALSEGVIRAMFLSKCKLVTVAVLVLGLVTTGVGLYPTGPALGPSGARGAEPPKLPAEALPKAPPTSPERQKQIEKLITDLGSDDFDKREAAQKELEKFGEEAMAALEKAAAGDDAETKKRAQTLLEPLRKRVREREAEKLLAVATKGGVDVLVDYMTLKGKDATDDDWDLFQKVVAVIEEKAGKKKAHDVKRWQTVEAGGQIINGRAIAAEGVNDLVLLNGALVARGPVTVRGLTNAVVFVNGDVTLIGGPINCIIVCDGDVTFKGGAINCVVLAGGSIRAVNSIDSVYAARGAVEQGFGTNITARPDEKFPLGAVKFFASSQLGVEAKETDGKVRVESVEAGTPLAKAGLQKGDVVTALGETKADSVEAFRRALRRQLADGKAVIKVRRDDREVALSAALLDSLPEKKPEEKKPEEK
jgi:RNA polymerase sigma factor (sigma-70 family)